MTDAKTPRCVTKDATEYAWVQWLRHQREKFKDAPKYFEVNSLQVYGNQINGKITIGAKGELSADADTFTIGNKTFQTN